VSEVTKPLQGRHSNVCSLNQQFHIIVSILQSCVVMWGTLQSLVAGLA